MRRRLLFLTFLFASLATGFLAHSSFAQAPGYQPPPMVESPPPSSETAPPPMPTDEQVPPELLPHESPPASSEALPAPVPTDTHQLPELLPHEQEDAVMALGELRNAVRLSPYSADDRLKLAQGLYRIGDLDAALDECRTALKLKSNNARAYLQLGVTLIAKQDGHEAVLALMEAIMLDPELTQAHYSLGNVQHSLGNLTAAVQSYRRALELQPNFLDARYRLALALKLTNRHQEAAQLMENAAIGGIPQAQYFMGNAYRNGQGVEKNLTLAIRWLTKAHEFGQQRAEESLSQLRRQALSSDQSERRRKDAIEGFRQYRDELWADYPDTARTNQRDSLGIALLKDSQASNGVTTLFAEAYALGETAHDELARLYETGLDTRLAQFDKRILTCFATTAADGFIPAKKTLARIYGNGLGVTPDLQKAKAMLKGLPKQEMQEILDEIAGR
jgi:TPR repeat protein